MEAICALSASCDMRLRMFATRYISIPLLKVSLKKPDARIASLRSAYAFPRLWNMSPKRLCRLSSAEYHFLILDSRSCFCPMTFSSLMALFMPMEFFQ